VEVFEGLGIHLLKVYFFRDEAGKPRHFEICRYRECTRMLKKSDLVIHLLLHHNKLDLDRVVSIGVYFCADDFLIWLQQELLGATLLPLPRHVFEFVAGPVEQRHA